jgi:hypothetical protein
MSKLQKMTVHVDLITFHLFFAEALMQKLYSISTRNYILIYFLKEISQLSMVYFTRNLFNFYHMSLKWIHLHILYIKGILLYLN